MVSSHTPPGLGGSGGRSLEELMELLERSDRGEALKPDEAAAMESVQKTLELAGSSLQDFSDHIRNTYGSTTGAMATWLICRYNAHLYRPAIEAGERAALDLVISHYRHYGLKPPAWLGRAGYDAYAEEEPRRPGRHGRRGTAAADLTADIQTAAVYRLVVRLREHSGQRWRQDSTAASVTADLLACSPETVRGRCRRASSYLNKELPSTVEWSLGGKSLGPVIWNAVPLRDIQAAVDAALR